MRLLIPPFPKSKHPNISPLEGLQVRAPPRGARRLPKMNISPEGFWRKYLAAGLQIRSRKYLAGGLREISRRWPPNQIQEISRRWAQGNISPLAPNQIPEISRRSDQGNISPLADKNNPWQNRNLWEELWNIVSFLFFTTSRVKNMQKGRQTSAHPLAIKLIPYAFGV